MIRRRLLLINSAMAMGLTLAAPADNARAGEGAGAPPADFSPVVRLLESAIKERAFPGCAAAAGTSRGLLWLEAFGRLDYEGGPPVAADSLYDLASLTKVVGTTSVVLALQRSGKLSLQDKVARYLPEFRGEGREAVTIEHLLTHSSGLPAWKPLYRQAKGYKEVLAQAAGTPLEHRPGALELYSDLGFILLGEVAARAGGKTLPELEKELIWEPLALKDTLRNPPRDRRERIAPTEVVQETGESGAGSAGAAGGAAAALRGAVHDENARAGEGITGHAGLFSTARDLSVFAAELLRGWRGESELFPADLVKRYAARRELVAGSSRALGWDTPSGESSAGTLLGPRAFGHTGFTGTSLWLDPDRDLYILLLTNRVHPTRANPRIARVRRELADMLVLCLERKIRKL